MSAEENKASVYRFYEEAFNQGKLDVVDELSSPDIIRHQTPPRMPLQGPEGFKRIIAMFRAAFPDLQWEVEDVIAEGGKVTARVRMRGTHQGGFMGIAPTGNQVTYTAMDFLRFVEGKAVEHWGNSSDLGLMQQLGAIPRPE